MRPVRKNLQIEFLESRVMLSGVDGVSANPTIDVNLSNAVQSNGVSLDVDLSALDSIFAVHGHGQGNITIDLSQLPASVVNLQISSFESVTLVGTHSLNYLLVKDIDRLDAGKVSVANGLFAYGVKQIRIDTAPAFILLQSSANGDVYRTLLEFSSFAQDGVIYSGLQNLGLSTTAAVGELNIISAASPKQGIMLNFQPAHLNISGIDSPSQVNVIKGDFTRYFLASPSERANLEQSLLVARQSAVTNLVPLATLLSKAAVQTAMGELADNPAGAQLRGRILPDAAAETGLNTGMHRLEGDAGANSEGSEARPHLAPLGAPLTLPLSGPETFGARNSEASPPAGVETMLPATMSWTPVQTEREQAHDGPMDAVALSLMRLSEPFAQMVFDLRHRFASFGDLAAARLSEQMRVDRQAPLLADTQPTRQRGNDVRIVRI